MTNLNGTWYNELGSLMTIETNGNVISGTYQTAVGDAKGIYYLVGLTDTDNAASQAVGWVVVWQNQYGDSGSVTSWSGQYQVVNGVPTIVTTWLLTMETNPQDDWQSTLVGQDVFTPYPVTQDEKSIRPGLKRAYPTAAN
jgi:Avidin family